MNEEIIDSTLPFMQNSTFYCEHNDSMQEDFRQTDGRSVWCDCDLQKTHGHGGHSKSFSEPHLCKLVQEKCIYESSEGDGYYLAPS